MVTARGWEARKPPLEIKYKKAKLETANERWSGGERRIISFAQRRQLLRSGIMYEIPWRNISIFWQNDYKIALRFVGSQCERENVLLTLNFLTDCWYQSLHGTKRDTLEIKITRSRYGTEGGEIRNLLKVIARLDRWSGQRFVPDFLIDCSLNNYPRWC